MREVYLFWFLRVILEWNVLRRRWELKLKGMWNLNGNIKILKKKRDKGGFLNVWVWFGNILGMEVMYIMKCLKLNIVLYVNFVNDLLSFSLFGCSLIKFRI